MGYFLAQHKARLGANKVVTKITIFRADAIAKPCILFEVGDVPTPGSKPGGSEGMAGENSDAVEHGNGEEVEQGNSEGSDAGHQNGGVESRLVRRSKDGKSLVREHVFRAKL